MFAGDGPHGFSPLFEQFVAGQQACLRELTYLFAPNINSYKRFADGIVRADRGRPGAWTTGPARCGWSGTAPSLRVENRVPGGDMNPYLAVAALIAAGLHGIEQRAAAAPELVGNAYDADAPARAVDPA